MPRSSSSMLSPSMRCRIPPDHLLVLWSGVLECNTDDAVVASHFDSQLILYRKFLTVTIVPSHAVFNRRRNPELDSYDSRSLPLRPRLLAIHSVCPHVRHRHHDSSPPHVLHLSTITQATGALTLNRSLSLSVVPTEVRICLSLHREE